MNERESMNYGMVRKAAENQVQLNENINQITKSYTKLLPLIMFDSSEFEQTNASTFKGIKQSCDESTLSGFVSNDNFTENYRSFQNDRSSKNTQQQRESMPVFTNQVLLGESIAKKPEVVECRSQNDMFLNYTTKMQRPCNQLELPAPVKDQERRPSLFNYQQRESRSDSC